MILEIISSSLLFLLTVSAVGWPVASRLALAPAEKLVATVALSLFAIFGLAWAVYGWALPAAAFWIMPVVALASLGSGWREWRKIWNDADARALLVAQLLVTAWCVGGLMLVVSYSGGSWTGDWFGHWQRTQFFLERGPRDVLFNGFDPLVSRPPLVNVVLGAWLRLTHADFAHYQLFSTLLASLAFLPAALLARHRGHRRAVAGLALLFMLSPLFVQNATYAWTKLPAAFFVLTAIYFFLRPSDGAAPRTAPILGAASLAAGVLTHYSTAPWVLVLTGAWFVTGWSRRHEGAWWRTTALAFLAATLVAAPWFGWAFANYGVRTTLFSNTAVSDQAPTAAAQILRVALNLRDTLVPHFFRAADFSEFAQRNSWGWWRDWFFQLYQTCLPFAFGSAGCIALAVLLARNGRATAAPRRAAWAFGVTAIILLGVGVHGGREAFGLAHICLQPLVLLGLAALAAAWPSLGRAWQLTLVAGATVDFLLGVALQFGVQSGALGRALAAGRSGPDIQLGYSQFAVMNLRAKLVSQWVFLGDYFAPHSALIGAALGALLLVAVVRATRTS